MKEIETVERIVDNDETRRIRQSLLHKGYEMTNEVALGLPKGLHEHIDRHFFTDELLGQEFEGVPVPGRERCRDVVECRLGDDGMRLNEYERITLGPIADAAFSREYNRAYTLDVPAMVKLFATCFSGIPVEERQAHFTLGVEFFRTHRKVVGYKHQDCVQFVVVYVVAREAEGAVTSLYPIDDPDKAVLAVTLKPGDLLIFRDRDFMHDATLIQPRFDGDRPHRDTVIVSFHYPTNYLKPTQSQSTAAPPAAKEVRA